MQGSGFRVEVELRWTFVRGDGRGENCILETHILPPPIPSAEVEVSRLQFGA